MTEPRLLSQRFERGVHFEFITAADYFAVVDESSSASSGSATPTTTNSPLPPG